MPEPCTESTAVEQPNPGPPSAPAGQRIRELVTREYAVVWRFLRRLGVPPCDVDDATQIALARTIAKCDLIEPDCERAYLMRTAYRLSFEYRRTLNQRQKRGADVELEQLAANEPAPDGQLELRRARDLLDLALNQLPPELRAVLTLFELEELTFTEIADVLTIPRGTVASRLRRARSEFKKSVRRIQQGVLR